MEDRCVICGEIVPEGTHVCGICKLANEAPCYQCSDRSVSCHTYCEKYIAYNQARERKREFDYRRKKKEEYYLRKI